MAAVMAPRRGAPHRSADIPRPSFAAAAVFRRTGAAAVQPAHGPRAAAGPAARTAGRRPLLTWHVRSPPLQRCRRGGAAGQPDAAATCRPDVTRPPRDRAAGRRWRRRGGRGAPPQPPPLPAGVEVGPAGESAGFQRRAAVRRAAAGTASGDDRLSGGAWRTTAAAHRSAVDSLHSTGPTSDHIEQRMGRTSSIDIWCRHHLPHTE